MKSRIAKKDGQHRSFDDFTDSFIAQEDTDSHGLFHEKTFIGTELGGKGHRLRNYVVISAKKNKTFSEWQKQIVKDIFNETCQKFDSKIEKITFNETYALIKMLVSVDVAIGEVIDKGILACNKEGQFLRFHYFAINTKRPDKKDIEKYLQEIESL